MRGILVTIVTLVGAVLFMDDACALAERQLAAIGFFSCGLFGAFVFYCVASGIADVIQKRSGHDVQRG